MPWCMIFRSSLLIYFSFKLYSLCKIHFKRPSTFFFQIICICRHASITSPSLKRKKKIFPFVVMRSHLLSYAGNTPHVCKSSRVKERRGCGSIKIWNGRKQEFRELVFRLDASFLLLPKNIPSWKVSAFFMAPRGVVLLLRDKNLWYILFQISPIYSPK